MSQPAIFLDRDGTLIEDADYLSSPEQIRILPRAIAGIERFRAAGYLVVVATNQSAVARGLVSEEQLGQIHERLVEQVEMLGGRLDAVLYCPHLPEGTVGKYAVDCRCRKPRPGLFLRARDELGVDLSQSFAIGDAWRDVEAALAVGVPSVKLARPKGREEAARPDLPILGEARDLDEAADIILGTTAEDARQRIAGWAQAGEKTGTRMAPGLNPSPGRSGHPLPRERGEEAAPSPYPLPSRERGEEKATATPSGKQPFNAAVVKQPPYMTTRDQTTRPAGASAESVETVLTDVRRMLRRQNDESFGVSRMFGYLAQGLALCLGIGGTLSVLLSNNPVPAITLFVAAIFAQLVALTMFLISRKSG